ncbi:MAG: DUF748 domain-containing protein [Propionivibrio sp.]
MDIMIDKAKTLAVLKSARLRKYVLRAVIAFVLIGVVGFLILPPVVKYFVLAKASEALHRTVDVKSIHINPYALSMEVEGLSIKEPDGVETFVSFENLYVNLESVSLFRGGPVVKELRLATPKVRIVRLSDTRYNFSDLMDEFMAAPKSEGPTPAFSVNNIQLTGGEVVFDDRPVEEKHLVSDINLSLPFISSLAYATEIFVEPSFSATFNGSPLTIKGRSKPFSESRESEIALDLAGLQLNHFLDYSPIKFPIKMLSGKLDTNLSLVFRQEKEKSATLEVAGTLGIKDVNVEENGGAPLLSFKQLDVSIAPSDLLGGRYAIERATLVSPEVHARVSKEGDVNWIEFFRGELAKAQPEAPPAKPAAAGLSWSLGQAKVSGGAVHWLDESHGEPFNAKIDNIDVDLRKLSNGDKPAEIDLSWRIDAGEWLSVERFAVKGGRIDLAKREAVFPEVDTRGARSLIKRTKDGAIDWLKPPTLRAVEASQEDTSAPWTLTIDKYHGEEIGVRFEDGGVSPAVMQSIENLTLDLENVTTVPGQVAKVATSFKLNKKGEVSLSGNVRPSPLVTDMKLDVKGLELLPLQPYFSEKLNVEVTRGQVAVSGDLQLRQEEAAKAGDEPILAGGFSGQATIGDFSAVDKLNSADFLRWKSFYFGKIDAKLHPDSLSISEIALSDFFARVIVTPEGKLNLMQIVRRPDGEAVAVVPDAAASAKPGNDGKSENVAAKATKAASATEGKAEAPVESAASKPMMPVKIGKITLQGGAVRFTDNFVKPNYTANLRKIGGSVTGLSSEPGSIADLTLRGSYDDVAPLSLTAKINPLSAKPYLDLQAEVKGIEMTSFSTYSGKYAGYAIDKGKLSVFVKYKIENDQLNAENRVFLDQLTFGDQVESPDATKLPVKLAIALLKNSKGEIDVNLPISGSLNDPQFSVGGLVIKVIVNLFVKAVTSPFALIGSMFGGGEELSNVEFASGRAAIDEAAQKRLENLAKALVDRPALKLEIEGRVDPENDPEGLKHARIERKVRAAKREDMTKAGVEIESLESIEVTDEEYPALLERVYRAEKFPKPRNMVGMVKTLPVEEMEKLILANSTVDEEDLIDLGDRRAKAVRDWLIEHQVEGDRIFLRPTQPATGGAPSDAKQEDTVKAARADFSLK